MSKKQRIGFIGLGVMGFPMSGHIVAAGYPLTVYDLSKSAPARLKSTHPGVSVASSPRAVAEASDIVVTMLPNGRVVHETVFGPQGLLKGFRPGALLLDTSSSEPWFTKKTAEALAKKKVAMVDAPVSGAEMGAIAAELVFMVGGDAASVKRVKPLLDVMGKTIFHLGPTGSGHVMKSINNLITAVTFLATAEGLVIGKKYGLDPAIMTDVLNVSTGMSWISRTHIGRRIISRRFDDPFKLDLMTKDIKIALKVAHSLKLAVPLSEKNRALWIKTQKEVAKGASVSELVRALEIRTGVDLISPSASPKTKSRRTKAKA